MLSRLRRTIAAAPLIGACTAPLLSEAQKRDIFYNNAARFLVSAWRRSHDITADDADRHSAELAVAAERSHLS